MLATEKVIALTTWIKNWRKTYGENPTLDECITWIEWKFEENKISEKEKIKIETILNFSIE